MEILFYRTDADQPITLEVAPTAIRAAGANAVPPLSPPPEGDGAYTRPYASGLRNSRQPIALPDGLWEVAATMPLDSAYTPEFVLHAGTRLLVQQDEAWQLFDQDGTPLAQGGRAPGDVVVDAKQGRFYTNDHTGFVKAWALATGDAQFLLYPMFGRGYNRSVAHADGERLWIVGTELPVMSHRDTRPPAYTILEMHTLGALQTDDEGMLLSNRRGASLMARPVPMLTATRASETVLAAPGHVFLVDEALQVTADLQGTFVPLALSLDASGAIYLIVRVPNENGDGAAPALWGLTPEGERFMDVSLPDTFTASFSPPLVGYDLTTYVLLEDEVIACDPRGVRWRHRTGAAIAGAIVTAEGQVVVTAGSYLWAFDPQGTRYVLFDADGDLLQTAPVLAAPNRLYVASATQLYHLTPQQ